MEENVENHTCFWMDKFRKISIENTRLSNKVHLLTSENKKLKEELEDNGHVL